MIFPVPSILGQAHNFEDTGIMQVNKYVKNKQVVMPPVYVPALPPHPLLQCIQRVSLQWIPGISYLKTLLHQQPFFFFFFAQLPRGLLKTDSNFISRLKRAITACWLWKVVHLGSQLRGELKFIEETHLIWSTCSYFTGINWVCCLPLQFGQVAPERRMVWIVWF